MATYSTDLQTITLCDSGTFTEFTGFSSGGAPSLTTENYIHNGSAVDQSTGQAQGQTVSIAFDYGSNITWTSGWVVMGWQYFAAPTTIDTWANGGMRIAVGSGLGTFYVYNAVGNNFGDYPYGGWQNTAIDPETATVTADQTVGGGNGGNFRYFGSVVNMLNKITKGSPHAIDAFRYGRGQIKAIGTSATFSGLATANDATTARWGLFSDRGGNYRWKGLLSLGDTSNSVTFSDSNKSIQLEDTPRVGSTFNKIEIVNASSSVTWNSISISGVQTSITGSAPVSRGDFEIINSAAIFDSLGCTYTDLGYFILGSGTDTDGSTFRRCGQITQNGATIQNTLITNSHAAVSVLADDIDIITNTDFISDGSNHAIELTSAHAGGSYSLTNVTFTNYATSDGSSGNEAIFNNSGGHVNINVSGGTYPYVKNGSGATTTVTANYAFTITGLELNTEVTVVTAGTATELYHVENASTSDGSGKYKIVYTHSGGGTIDVLIHHVDYIPDISNIYNLTLPSTDSSTKVTMFFDDNYSNP